MEIASRPASAEQGELEPVRLERYVRHVRSRIAQTSTGSDPFHHLFIEGVFPDELYAAILACMLRYRKSAELGERLQDNPQFVNRRYSLVGSVDPEVRYIHALFSDAGIKMALLEKFYLHPTRELGRSLTIHDEFEFVFTAAGRFQNIHVDIPAKYVSFVFYFPEASLGEKEQKRNATILYDRALAPHYAAAYRPNTVCAFAPHFHSYHGFSSTIDRNALVMFYINEDERTRWAAQAPNEQPPYAALKDAIEAKLTAHPLIEYGPDAQRVLKERERCLVNAPKGRVLTS
jgi:hypothetical protein